MCEDQLRELIKEALRQNSGKANELMQRLKALQLFFKQIQSAISDSEAMGYVTEYAKKWGIEAVLSAQISESGFTVLHHAVLSQFDELAELLLNYHQEQPEGQGLNFNLVDKQGNSPLHLACMAKRWGLVMRLIDLGYDVLQKNTQGQFALLILIQNYDYPIEQFKDIYERSKHRAEALQTSIQHYDRLALRYGIEAGNLNLVSWLLLNCKFEDDFIDGFGGDIEGPVIIAIKLIARSANPEGRNILRLVLNHACAQTPVNDARWERVRNVLDEMDCEPVTKLVATQIPDVVFERYDRAIVEFSKNYEAHGDAAIDGILTICDQLNKRGFDRVTSAEVDALKIVFRYCIAHHVVKLIKPISEFIPAYTFPIVVQLRLELINISKRSSALNEFFVAVNASLFMNFKYLTDTDILEQLLPHVILAGDLKLLKNFLSRNLRLTEVPLQHEMTIVPFGFSHFDTCQKTIRYLISQFPAVLDLKSPHDENVLHQTMRSLSVEGVILLRDSNREWFDRSKFELNDRNETPYDVLISIFEKIKLDKQLRSVIGDLGLAERLLQIMQLMPLVNDNPAITDVFKVIFDLYKSQDSFDDKLNIIRIIKTCIQLVSGEIVFATFINENLEYREIALLINHGCLPVGLSNDTAKALIQVMLQERRLILSKRDNSAKTKRYLVRILQQLEALILSLDQLELTSVIEIARKSSDDGFLKLIDQVPEEVTTEDTITFMKTDDNVYLADKLPNQHHAIQFDGDDNLAVVVELKGDNEKLNRVRDFFSVMAAHNVHGIVIGGFSRAIARYLAGFDDALEIDRVDLDLIATKSQRELMIQQIPRENIRHAIYNVKVMRVDPEQNNRFDVLGLPHGIDVQISYTKTDCLNRAMIGCEFIRQMSVRDMTIGCIGVQRLDDGVVRIIFPSRAALNDFQMNHIRLDLDCREMQSEWAFRICSMLCKDDDCRLPIDEKIRLSEQLMKFRLSVFSRIHYFIKYVLRYKSPYIYKMITLERSGDGINLLQCVFTHNSFINYISSQSPIFARVLSHLDGLIRLIENENEELQLTGVFLFFSIAFIKDSIAYQLQISPPESIQLNLPSIIYSLVRDHFSKMGVRFDLVSSQFVSDKLAQFDRIARSIADIFTAFLFGKELSDQRLHKLVAYMTITESMLPIGLSKREIINLMQATGMKVVMARSMFYQMVPVVPVKCPYIYYNYSI